MVSHALGRLGLGLLFLLGGCLAALAAGPGSKSPPPSAARESSPPPAAAAKDEVPRYDSVRKLTDDLTLAQLQNGLTVLVQENHVAPVATVRCYVKNTGGSYEGRYLGAGLSHVLEHTVAGGTTSHRSEKEIERIVNSFGGATNAYTSEYMTVFYVNCPARNTPSAIELVADSMQHVIFEPKEFERELRVVRRELADGEVDRQRVLDKLLSETVYTQSPARYPVIGYLQVLNRTNKQAIFDFYHERYVPNNQIFVVAGDVKTAAVLEQVAKQWIGTPRGYETSVAMPGEPEQLAPREVYREMDGALYNLALAWPTVPLSSPDLYPLDLAAYILGEGESSRLVRNLKYQRQLVLAVDAESQTPHYVKGWFGVLATASPEHWQEANDEILREVYRLKTELIRPEELAKAKKQKAAELVMGRQTVQEQAEGLGRGYVTARDPLFDEHYVDALQQVTAEQIRDVARRYFVPERLNRVIIAPPGSSASRSATAASGPAEEIHQERLPNGLRVLVKRHAGLPLVNLQVYVLGGNLVDTPAVAGRAGLVGAMLDKGTARHSAEEIAEYFDSIGGKLTTTAGRNTVLGSITVLTPDFPQAAALFAECFTQPAFREDEFAKIKNLVLGEIAQRADDPQEEAFELFYDNLPAASPYHIVPGGKKETVEAIKAADLRAYHAKYFVPENMIVTVFGDIQIDAALAIVRQQFGVLKPAAHPPLVSFDRDNAIPKSIARRKRTAKETGMVILGYPAPSIFQKKDYAALTVLEAVMAGYAYPGGWLFTELRGEGLVYNVEATIASGPAPGFFVILAQTQPDKVDEVVARIRASVARAKAGRIDGDEFALAKQRVVALHAQEHTTIAGQAQEAAPNALYGLGYDYDKTFDARIQAVTLAEVIAVARKYLENSVLVSTSPQGPAQR
jgi:zinc protease